MILCLRLLYLDPTWLRFMGTNFTTSYSHLSTGRIWTLVTSQFGSRDYLNLVIDCLVFYSFSSVNYLMCFLLESSCTASGSYAVVLVLMTVIFFTLWTLWGSYNRMIFSFPPLHCCLLCMHGGEFSFSWIAPRWVLSRRCSVRVISTHCILQSTLPEIDWSLTIFYPYTWCLNWKRESSLSRRFAFLKSPFSLSLIQVIVEQIFLSRIQQHLWQH